MAATTQPDFQGSLPNQQPQDNDTSMQVEFANKMGSRGAVKNSSGATIYAVEFRLRSPQVRFKDVAGSPATQDLDYSAEISDDSKAKDVFGSATFHLFHTRIDIGFRNNPRVELKCTKWLKGHYNYVSPAFNGQTLTWRSASGWNDIDYVVSDDRDRALGRFAAKYLMAGKKIGRLEFDETLINSSEYGVVVDENVPRSRREEILIIGSSVAYWVMMNTTAAVV